MKQQYMSLAAILAVLATVAAVETQTGGIRRALFNSKSSGEYNHFLPCSKLPTVAEVESVLREHRDVIEKLKQIRLESLSGGKTEMLGPSMRVSFGNGEVYETPPGSYNKIRLDAPAPSQKCQGKADIYIMFGGVDDSVLLKQIIGGDTFFGIPYRMHNI